MRACVRTGMCPRVCPRVCPRGCAGMCAGMQTGLQACMHAQAACRGALLQPAAGRMRSRMLQNLLRTHLPSETHFLQAQVCNLLSISF